MVETSDKTSPSPEKHFVDYNEAGSIMYIQQPKGLPSACWGGLMSTRAQFLRAEGVIIDGRMRDIREHDELNFPVSRQLDHFTRLVSPLLLSDFAGLCSGPLDTRLQRLHASFPNQRSTAIQRRSLGSSWRSSRRGYRWRCSYSHVIGRSGRFFVSGACRGR
jgi:hypothetical protein